MARMIPSTITSLRTAGEKKLYQIFKEILPDECVVRYEVMLAYEDHKPDFTIVDPRRGVCIAEIKDWGIEKIQNATPDQVWVKGYHGSSVAKPEMNPDLKCKTYLRDMRDQLVAMLTLRDDRNHLAVPVIYFLIFPNISRQEFLSKELERVIPLDSVILKDDLQDRGQILLKRYEEKLPVLAAPFTPQQQEELTLALDPSIVIRKITDSGGFIPEKEQIVLPESESLVMHHLSLDQEDIAKSLGEGPRLLRGIAGTGKTLILLYRAKLLAANDPNIKILILCWNTALSNYMKQAYDKFSFEAKGKVRICHFSEFVRDFLHIPYDPFKNWGDDRITDELLQQGVFESAKYDAVYVDEAQDFRKDWIEFIFDRLIRGEGKDRNFIIAADDAQRIYRRRDFSWDSLDFKFTGRSKILKTIYRNSARVWIFSAFLLEEKASYVKEDPEKLMFANQGKYEPLVLDCKNLDDEIDRTVGICQGVLKEGFAARNVLILYRHKTVPWLGHYPLVENLIRRLDKAGIASDWISQDAEAKRSFDWGANTVKISTVHSAKGMDSPVVIVIGVETFDPSKKFNNDEEVDETKLLYVAFTRAREFLVVCYSGGDGMVPQLKHCEREYEKYRDAILEI